MVVGLSFLKTFFLFISYFLFLSLSLRKKLVFGISRAANNSNLFLNKVLEALISIAHSSFRIES